MKPLLIIELPCQADNIDILNDSDIKKGVRRIGCYMS